MPIVRRRVTDAADLKVLAHPLRLALLETVVTQGPVTASQAATLLGESPSNCSWHLRKLAEHDFIEEAPGGTGRQRPWQMRSMGMSWGADDAGPEERRAGDALSRVLLERWVDRFLTSTERLAAAEPEWRRAADLTQTMGWLTREELLEVNRAVADRIRAFEGRIAAPEERPEGSRLVEFVAWGAPVEVAR
jgi:predicted ArsR family transcriptional regulator